MWASSPLRRCAAGAVTGRPVRRPDSAPAAKAVQRRSWTSTDYLCRVSDARAETPEGSLTAARFVERLEALPVQGGPTKVQGTARPNPDERFGGLRMGDIFALAKAFTDMAPDQIEALLESDFHEVRVGAVSIMDFQARREEDPRSPPARALRALPPPPRPHRQLGPRRPRRSARHRRSPRRQASRRALRRSRGRAIPGNAAPRSPPPTSSSVRATPRTPSPSPSSSSTTSTISSRRPSAAGCARPARRTRSACAPSSTTTPRRCPASTLRYAVERLDDDTRRHYLGLRRAR